jgi:hypothetical protein
METLGLGNLGGPHDATFSWVSGRGDAILRAIWQAAEKASETAR